MGGGGGGVNRRVTKWGLDRGGGGVEEGGGQDGGRQRGKNMTGVDRMGQDKVWCRQRKHDKMRGRQIGAGQDGVDIEGRT